MHVTMVLLAAWIAVVYLLGDGGALAALHGVALTAALFGVVLLHELGHALAARHFGIATRDITLLPIGGVSRLERMPRSPRQELAIAVAGPAVNLALAALVLLLFAVLRLPAMPRELLAVSTPFLAQLLWINLSLAAFNLLPAFPTDGGRAFRALLAMRLPRARATAIAATVGRGMAVLFALAGVFASPWLVLIAAFLYVSAAREAGWERLAAIFAALPVTRGMVVAPRTLRPDVSLADAAAQVIAGAPPCFLVDDGAGGVGVVGRDELLAGLERRGPRARVAEIMLTDVARVDAATPLDRAVEQVLAGTPVLVVEGGAVIGLLTADRVNELARLLGAAPGMP